MSERLYALLLRLFPARFRDAYAEEAFQLFRDRARDERSAMRRLRLWSDLLFDLAISAPRIHFRERRQVAVAGRLEGVPGFHMLEERRPHPAVVIIAAVVASALIWAAAFSLSRTTGNQAMSNSAAAAQYPVDTPAMKPVAHGLQAVTVEDSSTSAIHGTTRIGTAGGKSIAASTAINPGAAFSAGSAPGVPVIIDEARRRSVVAGAITQLEESYLDPAMARKMADALLAHEKHGDDSSPMDGWSFASLLSQQLQGISHDKHLQVDYSPVAMPSHPEVPTPEDLARYRSEMARSNCAIEFAKMLPHNIAYLKLNQFPNPAICAPRVAGAMQRLNGASAIIYDLRDNHGGDPHMVALVATYLFERRTHLNDIYSPRSNRTDEFWTVTPPPRGNQLWNKPAYVLTSGRTFSGGEEFCYDLKALKRATLIGEPTGGGAHLARRRWIDDNFDMRMPIARAVNPITKTDWEGTGVQPDIRIKADDALTVAEKIAARRTRR